MLNSLKRRRMLYERAFLAGRAAGHADYSITVLSAGLAVVYRLPVALAAELPFIDVPTQTCRLWVVDERVLSKPGT